MYYVQNLLMVDLQEENRVVHENWGLILLEYFPEFYLVEIHQLMSEE
jgi:hypothetical protein